MWGLLEQRQYTEAQALWDEINAPLREYSAKVDTRSGGQGRVKKGLSYLMGKPAGSSRPPSKPLNIKELDELREILVGFGWPVVN